jgi:glycosyltransferase involved in cell wall biosynthesis
MTRGALVHQVLDTAELGGGNLYALAVAERLRADGDGATIWCHHTGPAVGEAARRGLAVRTFDQDKLKRGGFAALWQVARLAWRLRRARGIVHVHSHVLYGFVRRAVKLAGVPAIAHVHIDAPPESYRWAFAQPPAAIVTCAEFLAAKVRDSLPSDALKRTRIVAVPNAIDTAKFAPGDRAAAKRKVDAPEGAPLVLMVANLSPHKGQLVALEALRLMRAAGSGAHLWLAGVERGGTAFTADLRAFVEAHSLGSCVKFLGQRADVPDLMRAADAVVLPSSNEGLPLTLLEAQASGTPVLAAPTAGVPEIVRHGATGVLIAHGDAAGYARELAALFADPARARALATAALAQARTRTFDAMCSQLRTVYATVQKGRP